MSTDQFRLQVAIEHLQRIRELNTSRDVRLTIAVRNIGGLAAHQTVEVSGIHCGFDWTAGQAIVEPVRPLTCLTPEQVEEITKSVRAGTSWHAYEREKKLHARIKALEAEVAALSRRDESTTQQSGPGEAK